MFYLGIWYFIYACIWDLFRSYFLIAGGNFGQRHSIPISCKGLLFEDARGDGFVQCVVNAWGGINRGAVSLIRFCDSFTLWAVGTTIWVGLLSLLAYLHIEPAPWGGDRAACSLEVRALHPEFARGL